MIVVEVDSPHDCGIEGLTVCVWFGFLSKEVESNSKEVSNEGSDNGSMG